MHINSLARSYNPLANRNQLIGALDSLFPNSAPRPTTKFDVLKIYNELLLSHYTGEVTIKNFLFNEFVNKKITGGFEIRVNSSRVDFLAINGYTKSFEIKSKLDNLKKLSKQSSDYSKAFEYNFVIIDDRHLENVKASLPPHYGIWSYANSKKTVHQNASLSNVLDSEFQLGLLTKQELRSWFKEFSGVKKDILKNLTDAETNKRFKEVLKSRCQSRWSFIKENSDKILPLDIQFFYSTNLSPDLVYQILP